MLIFWLVWRGLGFLVPLIAFGSSLLANLIFNATYGDGYYDTHTWPCGVAMFIAAILCWLVGSYVHSQRGRVVIDRETGYEFASDPSDHSFFFIRLAYWPFIILAFSIGLFGYEFVS